ncbi:MAG TPA: MEDS domain-containing protein, partial [Longimicrobiales bacterium]
MRLQTATSARNAAGIPNDHRHVVQFYEDDEFLFEAVSGFLIQGLNAGQPTMVFARPETRRACATRLERNGCDYSGAIQSGRLVVRDAREALATFMRGSMLDETRFINEVGTVVEKVSAGNNMKVRAYGEMVDVLFRDGNAQAALRLEELWNKLAQEHAFELLCAYSINNFYTETHAHHLKEICRTHSHVVPA